MGRGGVTLGRNATLRGMEVSDQRQANFPGTVEGLREVSREEVECSVESWIEESKR